MFAWDLQSADVRVQKNKREPDSSEIRFTPQSKKSPSSTSGNSGANRWESKGVETQKGRTRALAANIITS